MYRYIYSPTQVRKSPTLWKCSSSAQSSRQSEFPMGIGVPIGKNKSLEFGISGVSRLSACVDLSFCVSAFSLLLNLTTGNLKVKLKETDRQRFWINPAAKVDNEISTSISAVLQNDLLPDCPDKDAFHLPMSDFFVGEVDRK
ncbi:hypothetical protein CDAR_428301 [Caerostris darwini]|uniref:Uncharacterized protein n=1 Tax=Caerostris darwini TaxID=1538125 RepID=A0AAV4PG24_9ARAC|nr:hypothetical protein CDAR_428301 [Caerostris darwini]